MSDFFGSDIGRGINFLKNNTQVFSSIVLAAVIIAAFLFVGQLFSNISLETKERLENVRAGSIQDVLALIVPGRFSDTEFLNATIANIAQNNEPIREFKIVSIEDGKYKIRASLFPEEVGGFDDENEKVYKFATIDTTSSFTQQTVVFGERFFNTARAITDGSEVTGMVFIKESLAEADRVVSENIRRSYLILILVIIVILVMFFRHARIINYTALYRRLKEVDQMKDDFIGMASHELRSPLTVIRGYADILRGKTKLGEKEKETLNKIEKSAGELDEMVSDILDVSRLNQGRLKFELAPFDPGDLIKEVVDSFLMPAEKKGLKIYYESVALGNINVDRNRLRQVLVNLIGNALKYTQKGEIKVKSYIEAENLFIRVSDTGVGISSDEQKKLFQKFHRVRGRDTQEITGTGLGLWITREIVLGMKGKISVESIEGVGSHFIISFQLLQ